MAGHFEVVDALSGGYQIRMLDGDGALAAVSVTYPTLDAVREGIALAREIAGTGLVMDRTRPIRIVPSGERAEAVPAPAAAVLPAFGRAS
ncbi:hypothetical protein LVY72_18750 [Arthrobacter sp. I2-34]|uniref:DUF1508 domain-containing protein n=1 Tax=Arthrobacter hankyongi TaxID=2904801 RepID=A0ABS9LB87_9MICC|nr:hypothetical protein [Arthrobacter hankyongi]MCG2623936.1 hypothetical protein [Arthrobacter hankyongi]